MDEYKALDVENNVKVAVKKLREAYWSNDPDSYASQFCEAKQIIISAICFHDYTLQKESDPEDRRGEWIQDDDLSFDPARPWWYCSHCGERTGIKTKYCPECGFRNLRAGE